MRKALLAATLLLLGSFPPAFATQVNLDRSSVASTGPVFVSQDGCTVAAFEIAPVMGSITNPVGATINSRQDFVSFNVFDECTGTTQVNAFNIDQPGDAVFSVAPNGKSATLVGTYMMFDFVSNTTFDLSISVEWQASSPPSNLNEHFILPNGTRFNVTGQFRSGTATCDFQSVYGDFSGASAGQLGDGRSTVVIFVAPHP